MRAGFAWIAACGVALFAVTSPEQPLKNPAEEIRITAPIAHTHPVALVFTVLASSGLSQLVSWAGGGPRGNSSFFFLPLVREQGAAGAVWLRSAWGTSVVQGGTRSH